MPTLASEARLLANFYFWYFAFVGVFGTYFALYLDSIGLMPAQIALLMSLQQFVRIVTPFLWGWLADRLRQRVPIIRLTLLAAVAAFSLLFVADGYLAMVGIFIAMFVFWSAALPLFEASVIAVTEGDSGRYARIRLWGSVGFIVAVLSAGWALDHIPLRGLLWIVLVLLVIAAVAARALPEHRPAAHEDATHDSIWPILRRPAVLALFAACFLMMASQSAVFIFYSLYMAESGHSKSLIGVLWSVGVLAEITIFVLLPRINARFTPYQLFAFSYAMTAVRFLLVGWLPQSFAVQVLAQSLHAFTFGTWHAAAMAMLHQLFPGQFGTRGQALYTSFSFGVGGALGGVAAGFAWGAVGPAWTYSLMSLLAAAGLVIALRYVRSVHVDA